MTSTSRKMGRESLAKLLSEAATILDEAGSKKEIIEHSKAFRFLGDRIKVGDEGGNCTGEFPAPELQGLRGVVPTGKITEFLHRCKDPELEVSTGPGELLLAGKKVKAGITMADLDEETASPPIDESLWHPLPDKFLDAVGAVAPCAGKDITRPVLTMIHVFSEFAEACDNFQFARAKLSSPLDGEGFLFPSDRFPTLNKVAPTQYQVDGAWVRFRSEDGTIISLRTIEDPYIDLDSFIPEGKEVTFPSGFVQAMERAGVFTSAEVGEDFCRILLDKNQATIEAQTIDGWIKETSRIRYDEDPLTLLVRPEVFRTALGLTTKATVGKVSMMLRTDTLTYVMWLPDE